MTERLDYIRKLVREKGMYEVLDSSQAEKWLIFGENCVIQEGVNIAMDGFGYELNEEGKYEKFPHYAKVIMGDDVEILAGTNVCRGTIYDTIIGRGTKIAGNCQIGHSCDIGEDCLLGAYTIVCGSARLGDHVRTGQFVCIDPHVTIGNNVDISSFTLVSKDVPDGAKVRGIPGVIQ